MEVVMTLAGLGLLAILLQQSRHLPSEKDFERAAERLEKDYDDKKANQTVGMYLAFVEGEFEGAMQYLAKASSSTLRKLAKLEMDPQNTDTLEKKMKRGDEWVQATRSFKPLAPIFHDRAAHWYRQVWPKADAPLKEQLRKRAIALAASRPRGRRTKALPTGWATTTATRGVPSELDATVARSGSHSGKLFPADPEKRGYSRLHGTPVPVQGENVIVTAFVRTEGTDNGKDRVSVWFWDENGQYLGAKSVFIPLDTPFWQQVTIKSPILPKTARAQIGVDFYSAKGNAWIDDVSLQVDDDATNLIINPSFEK